MGAWLLFLVLREKYSDCLRAFHEYFTRCLAALRGACVGEGSVDVAVVEGLAFRLLLGISLMFINNSPVVRQSIVRDLNIDMDGSHNSWCRHLLGFVRLKSIYVSSNGSVLANLKKML